MNQIQSLFQSKKELRKWWAQVTEDPRFDDVLLHVRSMILQYGPSADQLAGARYYENAMVTIGQAEEVSDEFPSPGLHHEIDVMPPVQQPTKPNRKK